MSFASNINSLLGSGKIWFAAAAPTTNSTAPTLPSTSLLAKLQITPGFIYEWFVDRKANKHAQLPLAVISSLTRVLISGEGQQIIWIGRNSWPAPFFINENLDSFLFVDPPDKKLHLWAIETALRSPAVGAVIAQCDCSSMKVSRRFALAAKKSGAIGFLICTQAIPSAAKGRFQIIPTQTDSLNPTWRLSILKIKGQQPQSLDWLLEFKDDQLIITDEQRVSMHIPIYKVS